MKRYIIAGLLLALSTTAAAQMAIEANIDIPGIDLNIVAPSLSQGAPAAPCSLTGGFGAVVGSIQYSTTSLDCELRELYRQGRDDPETRGMAVEAYRVAYERAMLRSGTDQEMPLGITDPSHPDS